VDRHVNHVQLPNKTHPGVQTQIQTIHKTLEHAGFDAKIIHGPEKEVQGKFVFF